MMTTQLIVLGLMLFLLGLGIGAVAVKLWFSSRETQLQTQVACLHTQLEADTRSHEEKLEQLQQARQQISATFAALSSEALKQNNELFLSLANQTLKQFQVGAESQLDKKEKAIENLVKPIHEALQKTESQIREIEKQRTEAYRSLTQQLRHVAEVQNSLQAETRNLVRALRRPEVRGQWGEITLKRLVELAGMVPYCDFYEQESVSAGEGSIRPDMVVRMPDKREIVVDCKTPLDAYLNAVESTDDKQQYEFLTHHARNVRQHMKRLASKAYWTQFKHTPDFVVLFIPGDQFLASALEVEPELLEEALRNRVILATPTSIIALLRAIAFGWKQQALAENADRIQELGEELHHRIAVFSEHLSQLGKALSNSIDYYNKAVASLERNVLSSTRKFSELGIHAKKDLVDLEAIEQQPRLPMK